MKRSADNDRRSSKRGWHTSSTQRQEDAPAGEGPSFESSMDLFFGKDCPFGWVDSEQVVNHVCHGDANQFRAMQREGVLPGVCATTEKPRRYLIVPQCREIWSHDGPPFSWLDWSHLLSYFSTHWYEKYPQYRKSEDLTLGPWEMDEELRSLLINVFGRQESDEEFCACVPNDGQQVAALIERLVRQGALLPPEPPQSDGIQEIFWIDVQSTDLSCFMPELLFLRP